VSTSGKVCVIIPTFNRAYCLPATLESLQRQTYANWEALVIDDGSTDGTAALLDQMASRDPRIKYHFQGNRGVSAARNAGLRLADGDYVGFLDSDDAWEPWKLAAQLACFDALPEVGMVWTDMDAYAADGTRVHERYLRKMYSAYRRLGTRRLFVNARPLTELAPAVASADPALVTALVQWGDIYSAMIFGSLVHTSTVLLRHSRAAAVGYFDESFRTGEDYDFHLRTCYEGPVALLEAAAVRYRLPGGTDQLTSSRYTLEIARNALRTREAALARGSRRVELSKTELSGILATANAWVASELFESGGYVEARSYYWRTRALWASRPKMLFKVILSSLPAPLTRAVLGLYRGSRSA
jgi:glycosyltransferase involved in cell wall biosynthesis